ncbi:hypothetical protein V1512DRAFT_256040 [Lipomyces arxii]|uniref:uncharacterized protein n=1 Tax=Lipomyces arxii TaxID=56418 RepID=UPI0034CE5003
MATLRANLTKDQGFDQFVAYLKSRGVATDVCPQEQIEDYAYRWQIYLSAASSTEHLLADEPPVQQKPAVIVESAAQFTPEFLAARLMAQIPFQSADLLDETGNRMFPIIPTDPYSKSYVLPEMYDRVACTHDRIRPFSPKWSRADDLQLVVLALANLTEYGAYKVYNKYLNKFYPPPVAHFFSQYEFEARYRMIANILDYYMDRGVLDMFSSFLTQNVSMQLNSMPEVITYAQLHCGVLVPAWFHAKLRRITAVTRSRLFYYPGDRFDDGPEQEVKQDVVGPDMSSPQSEPLVASLSVALSSDGSMSNLSLSTADVSIAPSALPDHQPSENATNGDTAAKDMCAVMVRVSSSEFDSNSFKLSELNQAGSALMTPPHDSAVQLTSGESSSDNATEVKVERRKSYKVNKNKNRRDKRTNCRSPKKSP